MQELKAIHFMTHFNGDYEAFYPKAEADRVIEDLEESHKKEVGQFLMVIAEQKAELALLKESQERLNAEYERKAHTYSREQLVELRERINEAFLLNPYGKVFHVDRVEPDVFNITVDV